MTKYKFKLQKLLDMKIKEEEASKLEYTKAQNDKKALEDNIKQLDSNYQRYSNIENCEDIISQKIRFNYLYSITKTIEECKDMLVEKEQRVLEAKDDFIEKQINRKSLETLKENKFMKLKKEEDRKEQIENDEFALYAYIRNKKKIS
ncbi:flagellar export protein FliJ [[Clostridium] sordellii]|uniref:Flagellar FliJ protein n=1 Tax=Paraclostridium sordellii TaxID=1505 RepID=A0ABP1XTC5_PARSO|nr:flagellar export protein FliJ [Paeniclostridium sordellii]TAN65881.1 flagellar export protein FliJ [Paeniclostridium sordellii 8483]CEJ74576.1 Flagellar protein FliJ [[Clostridium] sordellii] [Paeniclostridium sordellii]CEK32011.1 flagellar export protein FliJ [[Clostridium] sordellii] [Paeniclostridium sordellii]CEN70116.1 flagellar export protein FliJ [[Clostridium] sordellii] [Paeniclostridium sordellii]CEN73439.1 flagellar export protein FliJ [[Clostridium] sordellii] [Paeniclostridium 